MAGCECYPVETFVTLKMETGILAGPFTDRNFRLYFIESRTLVAGGECYPGETFGAMKMESGILAEHLKIRYTVDRNDRRLCLCLDFS